MSSKRTILLAAVTVAIGFTFSPVHAQTADHPGAAPQPHRDDGAGLPLPTPPDWLTHPRPAVPAVNECDSIKKRIAQLQADQVSHQAASVKAAAEAQQEAKQADAAKDTWQKEEALWKSSSQAAQNASNPADKKLLQDAAGKHWWNADMAKRDYESLKQRSERDAEYSRFFLRMVTYAQREIDELNAKLQAACAEKKVAGGNDGSGYQHGLGPNVPLGGSGKSGGLGPNVPLGGSDSHGKINLPLGEEPRQSTIPPAKSAGDGSFKTPVIKQETQKVSVLPSDMAVPSAPAANQEQNANAPNLHAYFATQANSGGSLPANYASLQNPAVKMSVPAMSSAMPGRVEPAVPAMTQVMSQYAPVTMPAQINRGTALIGSAPANGMAVTNIGTRIGPITVTGR